MIISGVHKSKAVASDYILDKVKDGTLLRYFNECREKGISLYIPYGIRKDVEEQLDSENDTQFFHSSLKEMIQQRLVVNSRHKYQLEQEYKPLYRNLNRFNEKLSESERFLIALSLQLGINIETNDSRIIRIINEIKTTPNLQKYAVRLMSGKAVI